MNAPEAAVRTFLAFVSGGRKWLVLLLFIDIAFHLGGLEQSFQRKRHAVGEGTSQFPLCYSFSRVVI